LREETFIAAQWMAQTSAGAALAQMAARFATSEGELARLVREQQNLLAQWQQLDRQIVAAKSSPPERRNNSNEQALAIHLADTDRQVVALNTRLAKDFPDYAALANPEPLSIKATQDQIRADEALVQFAFAGTEGFIWVVTQTSMRWVRIELDPTTLMERVAALRCGLSAARWLSISVG
jgi:hypothetical protein